MKFYRDLLMYTFAILVVIMSLSALRHSLGKQMGKNRAAVRLLTKLKGGSTEQDDLKPFYALGVNVARQVSMQKSFFWRIIKYLPIVRLVLN